jgi:hypothetical protein
MKEKDKVGSVINKTEKVIGANGETYDYKNLIVQAENMEECKKVFDEEWQK